MHQSRTHPAVQLPPAERVIRTRMVRPGLPTRRRGLGKSVLGEQSHCARGGSAMTDSWLAGWLAGWQCQVAVRVPRLRAALRQILLTFVSLLCEMFSQELQTKTHSLPFDLLNCPDRP